MNINKNKSGFTLIETIIALSIFTILTTYITNSFMGLYDNYKFKDTVSKIQYLIKYARVVSVEKTVPMGICKFSNTSNSGFKIYALNGDKPRNDSELNTKYCNNSAFISDNDHIKEISFDKSYDSLIKISQKSVAYDPRGISIVQGNICVSSLKTKSKYTFIIRENNVFINEGTGVCS